MLLDVGHPKIQSHLVQKRWLGQGHAFGLEVASHIKHQPVRAFEQAGVVVQGAVWISTICVQVEAFTKVANCPSVVYRLTCMPAAGQPCMVSKTCVLKPMFNFP